MREMRVLRGGIGLTWPNEVDFSADGLRGRIPRQPKARVGQVAAAGRRGLGFRAVARNRLQALRHDRRRPRQQRHSCPRRLMALLCKEGGLIQITSEQEGRIFGKVTSEGRELLDWLEADRQRDRERGAKPMTEIAWSNCPDVESVPGRCSGAWVVKNSRVIVESCILVTPKADAAPPRSPTCSRCRAGLTRCGASSILPGLTIGPRVPTLKSTVGNGLRKARTSPFKRSSRPIGTRNFRKRLRNCTACRSMLCAASWPLRGALDGTK